MKKKKLEKKRVIPGGCIEQKGDKVLIARQYLLCEVCPLFNALTGCATRDCDKIHICSLCECETHSLPKCPRTNTKIGEILMKQIEDEKTHKGSAMRTIQLSTKTKTKTKHKASKQKSVKIKRARSFAAADRENEPVMKKAKVTVQRAPRINELCDVRVDYVLFVLDGSVWRRARVVEHSKEKESVKVHYLGWAAQFDECVSLTEASHRLSVLKPDRFYSEATLSKEIEKMLTKRETKIERMELENVQKYLKMCQLKNEGEEGLLRERLLNVRDEIRILKAQSGEEVIEVNMRCIDAKAPTQTMSAEAEVESRSRTPSEQTKKQKSTRRQERSAKEENCELCGSERHLTVDCPNNYL